MEWWRFSFVAYWGCAWLLEKKKEIYYSYISILYLVQPLLYKLNVDALAGQKKTLVFLCKLIVNCDDFSSCSLVFTD